MWQSCGQGVMVALWPRLAHWTAAEVTLLPQTRATLRSAGAGWSREHSLCCGGSFAQLCWLQPVLLAVSLPVVVPPWSCPAGHGAGDLPATSGEKHTAQSSFSCTATPWHYGGTASSIALGTFSPADLGAVCQCEQVQACYRRPSDSEDK